jgi:hypothetical protein
MVIIGKSLEQAEEERLIQFLQNNQDVSAWSSGDLMGVTRDVMEHVLNVDLKVKPVRQRLRTMSEEQKKAAQAEVQKLLDAGVNTRGIVLKLAGKCSNGAKKEWEGAYVYRLHELEQSLHEG